MTQYFLFTKQATITFAVFCLSLPLFFQPRLPFLLFALANYSWLCDLYQPYVLTADDEAKKKSDDKTFDDDRVNARRLPYWLTLQLLNLLIHDYLWSSYRIQHASSLPSPLWREWIGCLFAVAGALLRVWARVTLGRHFTYQVGIRSGHTLVTAGPYKWLLHPGYTGAAMVFIGLSILLEYQSFWITSIVLGSTMLKGRVTLEERVLEEQFGEQWRERKRRVARYIPFVW